MMNREKLCIYTVMTLLMMQSLYCTFEMVEILWFKQRRLGREDRDGLGQGSLPSLRGEDGGLIGVPAQAGLQSSCSEYCSTNLERWDIPVLRSRSRHC